MAEAPARKALKPAAKSDWLLLRSRFGRRLLLIFLASALLPTLTIALVSYLSVRDELANLAEDRLQTLAQFAGGRIYERLGDLESDLRRSAVELRPCLEQSDRPLAGCADSSAQGFDDLAVVANGRITRLLGEPDSADLIRIAATVALGPGRSAIVGIEPAGGIRFRLATRLPGVDSTASYLIGTVTASHLWADYDDESLPDPVHLTLWASDGVLAVHNGSDTLVVPPPVQARMERSATGTFRWFGRSGSYQAAYWTFPTSRRFAIPEARLILSQSETDLLAPMADFTKTFPLLLLVTLLGVLGFGLNQVRRRLIPLEALHQGTRRLAEQDFAARVDISSGDEIEDLANSFNKMATQIGTQFESLQRAADIDRAVLSLVDRNKIVETALTRLPELADIAAGALALLEPGERSGATVWCVERGGPVNRTPEPLALLDAEEALIRAGTGTMQFRSDDPALPPFARPLTDLGRGRIEIHPFRFGEDIAGAIAVRHTASEGGTRSESLQVARLADQVAVALGNARLVERVRFLAFYDYLTGLPNRMLYKERLGEALARAERHGGYVAVCFLDLDQFSNINDSLGHDLGDRLIAQVATRLQAVCRETDTVARLGADLAVIEVARLGGDEFTVVLPDLADPQDAGRVARRLLDCLREPFRLGTHEVFVSTSIGIAIYPEDGRTIDDLLKNADVAMYQAKEAGRNGYRMYSPAMNADAVARHQLEQRLRRAVEDREFALVYQPIIDLATGQVTGAEALVRWNHPDRGVVSPAEFIAFTEESGLIVRLGEWILRQACEQAKAWEATGRQPLRLGINLSARQLQDLDIVSSVRGILEETGLDPTSLVLELTESALMRPDGPIAAAIRALSALGVRFAIDDFGTGYSSLAYLKHFPVGSLKIDRAFVRPIPHDRESVAIATAIVALARALDFEVVAEGVENEEQARFLLELGCHRAQGYLIGPPVSPEEFIRFVDARAHLDLAKGA
ncbi:MAG: EAL domain-containing protein [Gemmatimonadales bacterium]